MSIQLKVGQVWRVTEAGEAALNGIGYTLINADKTLTISSVTLPEDGNFGQMINQVTVGSSTDLLKQGLTHIDMHAQWVSEIEADGEDVDEYSNCLASILTGFAAIASNEDPSWYVLVKDAETALH